MKHWFGSFAIVTALVLTACGRDEQVRQPPPVNPNPPIVAPVEQPADGYYNEGGVAGGRCGFLCRWRMRRQQRRQGCW